MMNATQGYDLKPFVPGAVTSSPTEQDAQDTDKHESEDGKFFMAGSPTHKRGLSQITLEDIDRKISH